MGNAPAPFSLPHFTTCIHTSKGAVLRLSSLDLVDHILLLRRVINHPEMIEKGEKLNRCVEEYCQRMGQKRMLSKRQQSQLPWQIDWIWHVHRLHPLAYLNDCVRQIPNGYLVDKKIRNFQLNAYSPSNSNKSGGSTHQSVSFIPSVDIVDAVLRQRGFLERFQQHPLYSLNLERMDLMSFEHIVQNYVSFMKLARKDTIIVPTFDIDLMWHTAMRYPLNYIELSTALCGYILDHDDSIPTQNLVDAYQETANQWKMTYESDYGQNVNHDHLRQSRYLSSCAVIHKQEKRQHSSLQDHGGGGGCGGLWGSTHSDGDGDGGSCGGGCGGGD